MRHVTRRTLATSVFVLGAAVLAACTGDGDGDPSATTAMATRTVDSGDVTVKITPVRIDGDVAEFKISFDTHSVDLDGDVAVAARLTVDGVRWSEPAWSGDGPGGHHREGTLRFSGNSETPGAVELEIGGLPEPAVASWDLSTT